MRLARTALITTVTLNHVIDLGPEDGEASGCLVAEGTPEEVAEIEGSYTGHYLRHVLNGSGD
jgi:excinuclease ABC subunit A